MNQSPATAGSPVVALITRSPVITLELTTPPNTSRLEITLPSTVALPSASVCVSLARIPWTVPWNVIDAAWVATAPPEITHPLPSDQLASWPTSRFPPTVPVLSNVTFAAVSTVTLPSTVAPESSHVCPGGTVTLLYVPL